MRPFKIRDEERKEEVGKNMYTDRQFPMETMGALLRHTQKQAASPWKEVRAADTGRQWAPRAQVSRQHGPVERRL